MDPITLYDVDVVSDLIDLITKDTTIADSDIKNNIFSLDKNDLVLVTKIFSGAMKITGVKKIDSKFISSYLK